LIEQAAAFFSSGQLYMWFDFTQAIVGWLAGASRDEGGGRILACAQAP
jgi:hypothetical protein